jgi:coenzyme F420 hydrogenase subunit beta
VVSSAEVPPPRACAPTAASRAARSKLAAAPAVHPADYAALERQGTAAAATPCAMTAALRTLQRMRATLAAERGAQWSGIATRLGERLLEAGQVDAVLTMAPDPDDKWRPVPVLVTRPEGMVQCRGMRMGMPLLACLSRPGPASALQ